MGSFLATKLRSRSERAGKNADGDKDQFIGEHRRVTSFLLHYFILMHFYRCHTILIYNYKIRPSIY